MKGTSIVCLIYTNEYHPESCDFSYGSSSAIWNNSGDTAYLRDGNGTLSDGYSPNPLRHPSIEEISITVGTGWEAQMTGAFFSSGQRLMDISWHAERLNIDSSEMLVSIAQSAVTVQDFPLYQIIGQFGIGQVELSSMFVDTHKHDADTQIGPGAEIWVGDISNSNQGLWGQENKLHSLPEGSNVCLETKMPTTHNTGSPTLCILWDLGEIH